MTNEYDYEAELEAMLSEDPELRILFNRHTRYYNALFDHPCPRWCPYWLWRLYWYMGTA